MYKSLMKNVCEANRLLSKHGLITLTWGNASEIDRKRSVFAIKPSGVEYDKLQPDNMAVVDLDGNVVHGDLRPSSDMPTHLELYRQFPEIGGIVHTHSKYATCFAQAGREIPCLGTTHADTFFGSVPITRLMTSHEINGDYERETGKVIAERFLNNGKTVSDIPGILVHAHGPFTWGKNAKKAVENSVVLENIAEMAFLTSNIDIQSPPIGSDLLNRHFLRKHGKNAYYGQQLPA
jgi:L-ribulose-5-phosphate 4-epimerase